MPVTDLGPFLRTAGKGLQTTGIDALVHAASMRRRADAHNIPDITVVDGADYTLIAAFALRVGRWLVYQNSVTARAKWRVVGVKCSRTHIRQT